MSIENLLGGYPVIGVLSAVLAGIALLTWEYIRLEPGDRWDAYAPTARRIAVTLAIISAVLIGSRFVSVLSHGGIS